MIACARAVEMAGLTPVFCDVTDRLVMDLDHLDFICSHNDSVMGVMPVHLFGRSVPMEQLATLKSKYGFYVIEDLAEAHGIQPHWSADASCWSFYKNKIVAGEEGGAVGFKSQSTAQAARSLRSLGFTEAHDYTHIPRGCNYRMSNVHAGLVIDSLCEVKANLEERRFIEEMYDKMIPSRYHNVKAGKRDVVWVYDIRVPNMTVYTQTLLVKSLNQEGIAARHGFKLCSTQEEFKGLGRAQRKREHRLESNGYKKGRMDMERLTREIVYLPVRPGVTTAKIVYDTSEIVHRILAG
jgi:perosamine synthetase